ncbi:hypothetical protein EXIGLDRAFT_722713 [Exidia glandulosa HHB12029]|uniref:Uncharacterized protein n=1 Tax=Exidia glandulosa HHB12029 TaxID=1314781 RepID=A0A165N327_EXIGL|nr:hypothetical protein EXIGLDRAFT_722713 [Exidia glandulosa HHB12029]
MAQPPYNAQPGVMTIENAVIGELYRVDRLLDSDDDGMQRWEPKTRYDKVSAWDEEDLPRLRDIQLYKRKASRLPDLGTYALGRLDVLDDQFPLVLADFISGQDHIFLANASGSGKTRLIAETLERHWGLYFTCTSGSALNTWGSGDLVSAISSIRRRTTYSSGVFDPLDFTDGKKMPRAAAAQLANNRQLTRSLFARVLLSRLLLFEGFLRVCNERHLSEQKTKHKWAILQLRTEDVTGDDPFDHIFSCLLDLSDDDVAARLMAPSLDACKAKLSFLFLDEAHVAQSRYRLAFATSDPRSARHAPLFREIVSCLADYMPQARLVVSGHQLDVPLMLDALLPTRSVRKTVRPFFALRSLDSPARCTAYLKHFFPKVSNEDCRTVFAWTRGRIRFVTLLVTYTLAYGARNILQSLRTILCVQTKCDRRDWTTFRGHYDFQSDPTPLLDEGQLPYSSARPILRRAVLDYAARGRITTLSAVEEDGDEDDDAARAVVNVVSLQAGIFMDEEPSARIFEPIVLLRLAEWVNTSPDGSIHGIIRRKLEDNDFSLHGTAFVEGLSAILWDAHAGETLDSIFDFPGLRPDWTRHTASLVLPQLRLRRHPFTLLDARPPCLVAVANTSDDVFRWLHDASSPFMIPDNDFGAELLFMLNLHGDCQVLVTVHTQFLHAKRTRRDLRLVPTRPDELYKSSPEDREKLMTVLAKIPPLPIGSRKRVRGSDNTKTRYAQLPLMRLLCFGQPWRVDEAYDPPVASVNFRRLLELPPPREIDVANLEKRILDSF